MILQIGVAEFLGVEGGIAQLKLSDGSVVSAKDVSLPADLAKQYKLAASYNDTAVAKAFLDGYSSYDGTIEAYAEEVKTAYLLGKEAGERGISDMIKTLPKAKQNSIVKNPATATAFDAGKARAKKQAEDSAKMKKAREAKNSRSEGDTKSKDNVFNSLDAYNSEEIASIKRDLQNQIAKSLEDIKTFITSSINGEIRGRLFIGKLKSDTSSKIKKDTGVSTDGYSVIITSDEIKHLFNQHGDAKKEELRGQEAITLDNITSVFDAIFNPDTVSVETDNNGVISLVFKRTNNGTITAVTIASVKKKALTLKSARITKKKQHISPLSDVQASNPTSKNERSMNTVSTDSISEKSEKVNTSDEKSSAKKGKKSKKRSKGSFTISEEVDTNNLTAMQKKAIKRLEILSSCLDNVNIVVEDKGVGNATGKYLGKNGRYDPNTDTIYVSVTAGKGNVDDIGDYALVETLSHEVVHFVKEHSESDYEKLKSFLQKNVYTAEQWNNLVLGRLEEYRKSNSDFTYEAAEEEVVANACQTMLNSPRVLTALAKGNYSLFERIKFRIADFFDNLIEKLGSNVFYTSEARLVQMSTQKMQKELEKKFVEAVRNARSDTKSRAESTKNAELVNKPVKASMRENNRKITLEMSEAERYNVLGGRSLENVPCVSEISESIANKVPEISSWDEINNYLGKKKRELIHKIASEFGVIGMEYTNRDIDLSFEFSANNFRESYNKQGKNYVEFAKLFSVFDSVVDSAVGIEVHNRNNYKHDPTLENMYVLASAYVDGDSVVPVKLEVKQFRDKQNTLYVAISLNKIKMTEVLKQGDTEVGVTQNSRSVTISISDLFKKINPSDKSFLKYIPDGFLNEEQKTAKTQALEEDRQRIEETKTIEKTIKSSERTTNAISTREMILDSLAMKDLNGSELRSVNAYRNRIKRIDDLVEKRAEINRELTALMNKKGSEAASRRSELNIQIKNKTKQIVKYDEQLFNLQNSRPLKNAAKDYFDSEIGAAC